MRAVCDFCDYFVIAGGTSTTHIRAIADAVKETLEKQAVKTLSNRPSDEDSGWLVLDYSGVVVHIFNKPMRDFYALERLWSDAGKVRASSTKRLKV
jgi:ribosome-associated protein